MSVQITRSPDQPITGSRLRVLYIAYPLLTVTDASAGGAEQVLWTLEREMARRGIETTVAASAGSRVSGELFNTGEPCTRSDDFDRRNREHQERTIEFVEQRRREGRAFDLIHDMSGSFWPRAAEVQAPVLATLHLPRHFYPAASFEDVPANVSFNCVSESQARTFSDLQRIIKAVPNGIALDRFRPNYGERQGLMWVGRICEEKGPHLALDIAARSGLPITLVGQVYPFSYHQQFFAREIEPRLRQNARAKWIDAPSRDVIVQLLRTASALLITSLVNETSSLVAMEAAASGTPVVAFGHGALSEVVKDGVTGFIAANMDDANEKLNHLDSISSAECVRHAQSSFSGSVMADGYERLYAALVERSEELLKVG
ncbi:MAG TPA: glycosyltransferase [Candidatus Acidoferrales bacterium]|jgi:glycosyltransferase involved in cell wall biosynthesis|nr:glycosyltransferase [Candidatus Acidoferrales bacterium]